MGFDLMVEVDHRVNSLLLHWVVISEHDLEIEGLNELSLGLVGDDLSDLFLELILVEFTWRG